MADASATGLQAAACPPPGAAQERGGNPAPEAQAQDAGARGRLSPAADPGSAPAAPGRQEVAPSVTGGIPENGSDKDEDEAPETCGAEGWEARAGARRKTEEVTTEQGAILMEEVEKQQVGEEKMEVVAEEQAVLGRLNLDGPVVNPLEAVGAEADRAYIWLERSFGRMRRLQLARRSFIIQNIPGFWVTAFLNHPQLSAMISPRDEDMLGYLMNLEVRELRHARTGYKFKFRFWSNPYFRNKVIVKEYECRSSGRVVSIATRIRWHRGQEPPALVHRNRDTVHSFFSWFSQHSLPEADRVAQIIKEDLWRNPLQYYLLGDRLCRARGVAQWPADIPPRPYGFQSG
ncbi:putative testis-specific Y-encoded-like protein 3 [Orycteropus afer afer]|uniref:Testis-specific Y-encoded-like protein 3 n=1 Tax=Orycteropus afer afer TaxID=1230840 RepID=A0A8B6ZFA3_ORYAF|nr:putative testis-specific Y-encoded-like protein 3 [Orycteropus afer afer]